MTVLNDTDAGEESMRRIELTASGSSLFFICGIAVFTNRSIALRRSSGSPSSPGGAFLLVNAGLTIAIGN